MPNRNDQRGNQGPRRPNPQENNRGKDEKGAGDGGQSQQGPGNKPGGNMQQSPASRNMQSPAQGQGQGGQGQHGPRHQRGGGGGGGGHGGQGGHGGFSDKRKPPFQGGRRDHQNFQKGNDTLNPLPELDAGPKPEKKFTGRCRLFVGNLANDVSEADFKQMFEKYGEVSETFLNSQKGFGFIRLDTRLNAETAKAALDGTSQKNRTIRVRFATHGAALKIKNIPPCVSNELLEQAFSMFGEVERAIVIVDDRGRQTSNGIVEFSRKPGAQNALNRIRGGVFLLTASPTPISVEPLEQKDEDDGNPERYINKNREYQREREQQPRFAQPGSFEYEWGQRMKVQEEEERLKREQLEKNIEGSRLKMQDEMDIAKTEHQTMVMRQELMRRQEELQRLEEQRREFEMKRNQRDELRRQEENMFRQQQEEVLRRRQVQQDDIRLQQQDILRRQQEEMMQMEQGSRRSLAGVGGPQPLMVGGGSGGGGSASQSTDIGPQQLGGSSARPSRFDQGPMGGFSNGQNRGGPSQGGPEGNGGQSGGSRGGPGAPGVLGSAPGNQGGGSGPGNQGGRGGPNQGGRGGPNQGGRGGQSQGGRGPNQGQGPNQGGPGGAAYGSRGPQRPQMDEGRGRMPVERREADRGSDRGRVDRRDDFMNKRMRRF